MQPTSRCFLIPFFVLALNLTTAAQEKQQLRYHPSIKTGPVAGAIFSNPAIGDFDGDGTADLITASKHHGAGIDFYQGHPYQNGQRLFAPATRLKLPLSAIAAADWNRDGLTDLIVHQQTPHIRINLGGTPPRFSEPQPIPATADARIAAAYDYITVFSTPTSHTLFTSRNNFEDYWPNANNHREANIGFWRGYDDFGQWKGTVKSAQLKAWTHSQIHSRLTADQSMVRSINSATFLTAASPIAIDIDQDTDHDLIIADFNGVFSYAINIGTDERPNYLHPKSINTPKGNPLHSPQCFVMGQGFDWNEDGWEDLIFGCEDSFIHVCLNQQDSSNGPIFAPPFKAICETPPLDLGVAACPWPTDLDQDGTTDLLIGNAAGELWRLSIVSDHQTTTVSRGRQIRVNQKPFRLQAGESGSIQGPAEATWGYIAPSTCDLDRDGDQDIVYSGITGYHYAMLNTGNSQSPRWSLPIPILVDQTPLRTVWRTRPLVTHYDADSTLYYVCLNAQGIVGHYRGTSSEHWNRFSEWTPWTFPDSAPIDADGDNGLEGRSKISLYDWDGDGRRDLLIGVKGDSPWARDLDRTKLTYIMFLRNMTETPFPTFARPRPILLRSGAPIELGDHTACPSVVALNEDTEPGLLIGGEDGRLYYFSRADLTW